MSSSVSIKAVTPGMAVCGEAPFWDEGSGTLLFVDIPSGKVHRYCPQTGATKELKVEAGPSGAEVGFVLPCAGAPDLLLVGLGRHLSALRWPADAAAQGAGRALPLVAVDEGQKTRMNDAKCDPRGRVWAGTMGEMSAAGEMEPQQGALYRITGGTQATSCVQKVSISNGLAWSRDKKTFYYIDSMEFKVEAFDYDDATGNIGNRRTVFDYKKNGLVPDLPDGMTIDVDGNLWVANFFGSKIICIEPSTGKLVRTIAMPAQNMTSLCWGGAGYSTLYATSGRVRMTEEQLQKAPINGALFEITGLGTSGFPSTPATVPEDALRDIRARLAKA